MRQKKEDFYLREENGLLVFEPRSKQAKVFLRWCPFPVKLRRGQAAEWVSFLIGKGFEVVGERSTGQRNAL